MTLLLLAGTGEAKAIAQELAAKGTPAIASLAGATRSPAPQPLPTRHGGFGGAEGFVSFLREKAITRVLDATHPFASRITARTANICARESIPYACLMRPEWQAGPDDRWIEIDREQDAAQHVHPTATVFLATGRQTLESFANLAPRRVICRQIDPPTGPFPFRGGEFLMGRPPFSVAEEIDLFERLSVDVLVVKNAGGDASRSKLEAARALGLLVLLIKRPPLPAAPILTTVKEAVTWATA